MAGALTTCEDVTTGSGVYTLTSGGNSVDVYCDMETDGGGWALFYKRSDGSINPNYGSIINGKGSPGDSEFVVSISDLKTYLDSLGDEVSLLIEMTKDREHAFALYQNFRIIRPTVSYYLRVEHYDEGSTAGSSLTLDSNIVGGCSSIFIKNYYNTRCHNSSPFGSKTNPNRNYGIHWPSWLGDAVSLDTIQMKFRKWNCDLSVESKCHLCDDNYALTIDSLSG